MNGCGITWLADGICELDTLEVLSLAFNELSCLPDKIGNMSGLKQLLLLYNNFTEIPPQLVDIKTKISLLPSLESLQLHGNIITNQATGWEGCKYGDNLKVYAPTPAQLQLPSLIIDNEEGLGKIFLG